MEALSHEYRCYALDFWGFGESGKKRGSYFFFSVADYMELVRQFHGCARHRPGADHRPTRWAARPGWAPWVRNPDRIYQRVRHWLANRRQLAIGCSKSGPVSPGLVRLAHTLLPGLKGWPFRLASPVITAVIRAWYDMVARDLSATTVAFFFFGSIRSLRRTDLRPRLPRNKGGPFMGIYGGRDVIVKPA